MKTAESEPSLRVGLLSLGCAKNLVDSEIMLGALLKEGFELTNDSTGADVVIVNSCSFIDAAQQESVDAILQSDLHRAQHHPAQALIVAGCLPQRFPEELPKLLPEVDAFIGVDQVADVPSLVRRAVARRRDKIGQGQPSTSAPRPRPPRALRPERASPPPGTGDAAPGLPSVAPSITEISPRPSYIPDFATPRFRLTAKHFAYLKIAEGCNHPCSFCTIPRMRGSHRSRPAADIVREARALIADSVKEINLISQDSTYYGLDLRPQRFGTVSSPEKFRAASAALPEDFPSLPRLLEELNGLEGKFWIRLLYTHPAHWTRSLMEAIAACPKVARYIDLPLQHIHDDMLERMRRETSSDYIRGLIRELRERIPGVALRTTFIVGFPGETEEHFETLLSFIREARFERLGVFAYSRESGTRAGGMRQQVPAHVKQRRRRLAMLEQQKVARASSRALVGSSIEVLVERQADEKTIPSPAIVSWEHGLLRSIDAERAALTGEYFLARGEADAPDIDGRVYVRGPVVPGRFASVRVVGHTDYDLLAEA